MDGSPPIELPGKAQTRQFSLVAACFLISGFAALLYETVWIRQFAILLGTSEQALAVVLASYMGGLAIGSLVASRVVDAIRRPLLTYGLLELGVALAALFVPVGITLANSIQSAVLGGNPEPPDAGGIIHVVFCFGTAFGLILIPTALMGATLPLLARHVVTRDEDLGPKIGLLYAINTAGAVIGTVVAAFLCLPALGLGRTTWIGVGANLLVFLIVLALVRHRSDVKQSVLADASSNVPTVKQDQAENSSRRDRKRGKKRRGSTLESSAHRSDISTGDSRVREKRAGSSSRVGTRLLLECAGRNRGGHCHRDADSSFAAIPWRSGIGHRDEHSDCRGGRRRFKSPAGASFGRGDCAGHARLPFSVPARECIAGFGAVRHACGRGDSVQSRRQVSNGDCPE